MHPGPPFPGGHRAESRDRLCLKVYRQQPLGRIIAWWQRETRQEALTALTSHRCSKERDVAGSSCRVEGLPQPDWEYVSNIRAMSYFQRSTVWARCHLAGMQSICFSVSRSAMTCHDRRHRQQ
ncbi:hypothetical protein BV22DRAFT_1040374 [Leucogyrophana mollusca]|uniref:Uncharacterized protein n=1 Tax=Leucogyrophana mollusca TaxID=85980 RepID=A0ACB8B384_9AGAM|nr:hypothetical protein BV22DRAFT_1040374 [Leucogyrophana mollusca]